MSDHRAIIGRARRRIRAARVLGRLVDTIFAIVITAAVTIAIDTTSPLAPGSRVVLGGALVIGAIVAFVWSGCAVRVSILSVAQRLEGSVGASCNTLLNALQLSRAEHAPGVAHACALSATARADEFAREHASASVVHRGALRVSMLRGLISLMVFLVFLSLMPRVAHSAWMRFTEPHAGHPPYSRTAFELTVEPAPVLATMDATVRVRTSLVIPRTLELIDERTGEPLDTREREDGVFVATLTRLTGIVTLHARAPTGRSRTITISPIDQPMIERATLHATLNGTEVLSRVIPITESTVPIRVPVGASVRLTAVASIALGECQVSPERAGVETSTSGRITACDFVVSDEVPFDISLTPVSRSGIASSKSVLVRVEPVATSDREHGPSVSASAAEGDEPKGSEAEDEAGPIANALSEISDQIQQMTDEQMRDQAESVIEQIDAALTLEPAGKSEQDASETLADIRKALFELLQGVPGASERAREATKEREQKPAPDDSPERGDPTDPRDQLVIDANAPPPTNDAPPAPASLRGDTLVVQTGAPSGPVRITLDGAARDLYASLGERERKIVARYYRELAARDAEREDTP